MGINLEERERESETFLERIIITYTLVEEFVTHIPPPHTHKHTCKTKN